MNRRMKRVGVSHQVGGRAQENGQLGREDGKQGGDRHDKIGAEPEPWLNALAAPSLSPLPRRTPARVETPKPRAPPKARFRVSMLMMMLMTARPWAPGRCP